MQCHRLNLFSDTHEIVADPFPKQLIQNKVPKFEQRWANYNP